MKRKLFVIVLFVYSIIAGKVMAQTVALDYYFNHETHTTKDGQNKRFHYMWEDTANSGFSIWGDIFKSQGAKLTSIEVAPTSQSLKGVAVYIIVDPDSKKENPSPNYIQKADADNIAQWVKAGGVLVLMANDSANVELQHFNILAGCLGCILITICKTMLLMMPILKTARVSINNNPVFKTSKKPFLKDVCSITLTGKATAILQSPAGATIAAITKYGKGTVFAVGDPWLYNEYVNGRLPAGFDNDKAAADLTKYLLLQVNQ
jgi:hypothetical protein